MRDSIDLKYLIKPPIRNSSLDLKKCTMSACQHAAL